MGIGANALGLGYEHRRGATLDRLLLRHIYVLFVLARSRRLKAVEFWLTLLLAIKWLLVSILTLIRDIICKRPSIIVCTWPRSNQFLACKLLLRLGMGILNVLCKPLLTRGKTDFIAALVTLLLSTVGDSISVGYSVCSRPDVIRLLLVLILLCKALHR